MKDLDSIERKLARVSRKPAPPELKEKVLSTTLTRSAQWYVLSPAMRLLTAVCMVLIIVIFLGDSYLSQTHNQYLADLLRIERSVKPQERPLSEEFLVEIFGAGQETPLQVFLIKQNGPGESVVKRKDQQRLNHVLKRWENEI
jgi:hypothetical protein